MSGAAGGPPRNNIGALRIKTPPICDAAQIARLRQGLHPDWNVQEDPFIFNDYIDHFDCIYVHRRTGQRTYNRPANLVDQPRIKRKREGGKRTCRRGRNHKRTRKIDK